MLLWAWLGGPASAQRLFRLGSWTGFTELRLDLRDQSSDALSGRGTRLDRELAEERIALRNRLTVASSRFLTVDYGFTLGLLQTQLAAGNVGAVLEARGEGELTAFDVTATLRPVSPRRTTFLLSRSDNETPVEFAGTQRLRNDSLGVSVELGPASLPGRVRLRELELESLTDLGELARGVDYRRRSLEYVASGRWDRHQLEASYLLESLDDRITPRFSHDTMAAHLSHRFEILAPRLAVLSSVLRYFDRGGEVGSASLYLDELLRLQHRRNLVSSARYVVRQLEGFSGFDSRSQQGTLALSHRLFESLETEIKASRSESVAQELRSELVALGLASTYRKRLPGGSRLFARVDARRDRHDRHAGDAQELITEERHTLRFGIPARLDRPGVLLESVIVSDELGTTLFEQGFDYELVEVGTFVEVLLLPGGRIRDAQRVLVEYRVVAPLTSRYQTARNSFDLSLDFGPIEPFVGLRSIDHRLEEGVVDSLLFDQEETFGGLRLHRRGSRLSVNGLVELADLESEIQTFESLRFGQALQYRLRRGWTLTLNLAHVGTDYSIPVRETRASEARVGLRWQPRADLSLEGYASARDSTDTFSDDQSFERIGFRGRWAVGKIVFTATAEDWSRDRSRGNLLLETHEGWSGSLRFTRRFFPGRLSTPGRRPAPEPWPEDLPGLWSQPPSEVPDDGAEPEPVPAAEEPGSVLR